jgi:hypothetical protein
MDSAITLWCRGCGRRVELTDSQFRRVAKLSPGCVVGVPEVRGSLPRLNCSKCHARSVRAYVDGAFVDGPKPGAKPTPKQGGGATGTYPDAERKLDQMLKSSTWLRQGDLSFLTDVARKARGRLTQRQAEAIRRIYERFERNQTPKFLRG